jgi:hypothetical protein
VPATGHARQWLFATATLARPTGGDIALFELLNALAAATGDHITLVHLPFQGARVESLADIPWMTFNSDVSHRFTTSLDASALRDADVVVYTMKAIAGSPDVEIASNAGGPLPILFLQGLDVFPPEVENRGLRMPGLKVCVGRRLAESVIDLGVPATDIVHIPNGVDPDTFHVTRPIIDRPPRVAMNFDPHPVKGGLAGIEAIQRLGREVDVAATLFGTRPPEIPLGDGLEFVVSPSRSVIARDIYNSCGVYLQPSRREGFGMSAVEAMACGCALVTTANGGADDYALDGETALVCSSDPGAMADALARLLHDDALRIRIATNGSQFVERFRWDASARQLEAVAADRLAASRQ